MIYADSNVPMYLVGAEHPLERRVMDLVPRLLSSRDCLHVAVMRRVGCARVWSYDAAYDVVPSIQRIA